MENNRKIIKVKKNEGGNITDVMLEDGSVLPINHAILFAKDGKIPGVGVVRGEHGGEFLRIDRSDKNDGYTEDFSSFPVFH